MKRKSMGAPSGFRDLLPKDASLKEWLVQKIGEVYKKYGFLPIETPLVEFTETLAGEVTDFNLYSVVPSKERQSGVAAGLSLRFDQTVPLARFVVDNGNSIAMPFKRYVFGPVFRGETAQIEKGRYRQFDQFDADIVGSANIASDIEILLCMRDVMKSIVGERFVIRTNTRKLLNCLPTLFSFDPAALKTVLIELDKRDKVSKETLLSSLIGIGLVVDAAEKLIDFGSITGNPAEVLQNITALVGNIPEAAEALEDLKTIADTLTACGVKEIEFDISIIRGLSYYTGLVFETVLLDAPQFGSVYSGGRYDGLVESFGVQSLPAVGASVGVDRMIAALQLLDFKIPGEHAKVIILIQDPQVVSYAFEVSSAIRREGIVCEVYTGSKRKLGDQFAYADKLGYDYSIVVGTDEMTNKTVNLKNQKTGEKQTMQLSQFSLNN